MSDSSNSFKGHHGTLESCFRLIEKEGFRCSKKNNEWLGWGIYFFAEYEDAQWWANNESLKKTKRGQKPCVITALVKYKNNEYLDLDVRADKREFDKLAADLSAKLKVSLHFKTDAQWRCYYSNLVFRSTTVKGNIVFQTTNILKSFLEKWYKIMKKTQITVTDEELNQIAKELAVEMGIEYTDIPNSCSHSPYFSGEIVCELECNSDILMDIPFTIKSTEIVFEFEEHPTCTYELTQKFHITKERNYVKKNNYGDDDFDNVAA